MTKTQIILNQLEKMKQTRLQAQIKADQNLEIARQNKKFQKLEKDLRKVQMEISKLETSDEKIKAMHFEYNQLRDECNEALKNVGLTYKDTVPQYNCPICNDVGFVNGKKCSCLIKKIQEELVTRSGIGQFNGHTFDDVDYSILAENPVLAKAFKVANDYVSAFPNYKYKNLVIFGDVGTGKTFLTECIASELIKATNYVVFVTSFDLNNTVLKSMNVPFNEREDILEPLLECDLLIIDDLGSEPIMKNVSINSLYTIINERQRHDLPTITSTNLTPQMIQERYGDRLISRIFNTENTLAIKLTGKDLRISKKK